MQNRMYSEFRDNTKIGIFSFSRALNLNNPPKSNKSSRPSFQVDGKKIANLIFVNFRQLARTFNVASKEHKFA